MLGAFAGRADRVAADRAKQRPIREEGGRCREWGETVISRFIEMLVEEGGSSESPEGAGPRMARVCSRRDKRHARKRLIDHLVVAIMAMARCARGLGARCWERRLGVVQ